MTEGTDDMGNRKHTPTVEDAGQRTPEATPPDTPEAPDWRSRVLVLESDLARVAQWNAASNAALLLEFVRAMVKVRAIRLLDQAERLSTVVLSGETDPTLLRARMAAFQVELGRAANEAS